MLRCQWRDIKLEWQTAIYLYQLDRLYIRISDILRTNSKTSLAEKHFNQLYLLLLSLISVNEQVFIVNHPWGRVAVKGFVTATAGGVESKGTVLTVVLLAIAMEEQ